MIASLSCPACWSTPCWCILGRQIGFTLTLAGIAGFIVAIGITADSFVVFFERMKDEIREGRSPRVRGAAGLGRARRTILSADAVSFLAAAILYFLAVGDGEGLRVHPRPVDGARPGDRLPVHPPARRAARPHARRSCRRGSPGWARCSGSRPSGPPPSAPAATRRPAATAPSRHAASRRRSPEQCWHAFHRLNRGEAVFDFIGHRKRWYWSSAVLLLLCVGSFVFRGFNFGIEFDGGTQFQFPATTAQPARRRSRPPSRPARTRRSPRRWSARQHPVDRRQDRRARPRPSRRRGRERARRRRRSASRSTCRPSARPGAATSPRQAIRGLVVFLIAVCIFIAIRFEWKMAVARDRRRCSTT